jgi:hypothetical protein
MSASKRQTTFAKMKREQEVRERRAKKLEKKRAAAAERRANESGVPLAPPVADDEIPVVATQPDGDTLTA